MENLETGNTAIKILLIEDHLPDIRMIQKSVLSSQKTYHFTVISNGDDAVKFVQRSGPYRTESFLPDLILLDWVLPARSGLEILQVIKSADCMRHIPVIVMINEPSRENVLTAYQNYANSVIRKPLRSSEMGSLINSVEQFWFSAAELPKL